MLLNFTVADADAGERSIAVEIDTFVIAGWAGRDRAAVEHHIEELEHIGVPRPSAVPLFYRVAANQLTQDARVQAVGPDSSGEVETFVFAHRGETYVSLVSDHTDRKLESHSVALSKQLCAKPVGRRAWRMSDVAAHWDELQLVAHIEEGGASVVYQQGPVGSLRTPQELLAAFLGRDAAAWPEGLGMSCGTVSAIGGIRPSTSFSMALEDPRRGRRLEHRYDVDVLPVVA